MTTHRNKFSFLLAIFLLTLFLLPASLQARTMLLIHGYLADGMSWRTTKATKGLVTAGWKDGGHYSFSQQGLLLPINSEAKGDAFFTVDLPSKAPISVQTNILGRYLEHLYLVRNEPVIFVGHSAGGIVARLYLINPAHVPALSLITISTPHLGTPSANIAYSASDSPLGIMLDLAGQDDMRDSRGLYSDLKTALPNTFLYWLNQQPHPRIPYVSVIRSNEAKTKLSKQDFIVPPNNQNMNNVWALRGQSLTYLTRENHFLSDKDGLFLIDILKLINNGVLMDI
jgi:pimeloyl-ACP methyl ester carboxylesterase